MERYEAFIDLFEPLICCLEVIKVSTNWNRQSRLDAQLLLLALTHYPFIVALVIYTKALSVKLQGRYVDVASAYNQISFVKTTLQSARNDVDTVHAWIHETALEIPTKVGVNESMPRTASRQQHRANVPSSDPSEYYKGVLTVPTLDQLIIEMDGRFHYDSTSVVFQIMLILPSTLVKSEEILTSAMISDLPAITRLH